MREIKFRVMLNEKSKNSGQWVYFNALDFKSVNIEKLKLETSGLLTGLKDKNGKDIYEGDIIQVYKYDDNYDFKNIPDFIKVINSNFYSSCGCCSKIYGYDITGLDLDPDSEIESEIIGNIHSNPEILENK